MTRQPLRLIGAVCVIAIAIAAGAIGVAADNHPSAKHVLLLSIDGLHQSDLDRYVKQHPTSALAALVSGGAEFTAAKTPSPSDSFPGMVAQATG
ncbi:MAG TPA: alkaline phosphatase family protein, partial [Candidatus Dormibacteraeota bacterium]|nr:alkaline phosphatase family protein [Candidatus Dormibacteraeota bacterium]